MLHPPKSKKKQRRENPVTSENGDLFPVTKTKKLGKSPKRKSSNESADQAKKSKTSAAGRGGLISSMEKGLVFHPKNPQRVELLSFKDLKSDMQLLAAVKEIKQLEIIVSLPDGMLGSVAATEISDELTEQLKLAAADPENTPVPDLNKVVRVGQLLRTVVLAVSSSARRTHVVSLSINPSRVNAGLIKEQVSDGTNLYGVVRSVEDHGYVIAFGVSDLTGFLKKMNVDEDTSYVVGQPIETVVISKPAGARAAVVSARRDLVARSVISDNSFVALAALRAGMLVNAKITVAIRRTLQVQFLELFHGHVDSFHVPLSQRYAVGQKVRARIIAIDYESKRVHLSLLPHIVNWSAFSFAPELHLGLRLRARCARMDAGIGAMFEMYVPRSGEELEIGIKKESIEDDDANAGEQDEEQIGDAEEAGEDAAQSDDAGERAEDELPLIDEDDVPVGDDEVEGFAPADDLAEEDAVAAEESALAAAATGAADLPEADEQIGTRLRGYGYAVMSRLSDEPIKRVHDKCGIGQAYRSKVLGFNYFEGLVNLTLKKSALEQKYDSYADIRPGELVDALVLTIGAMGLLVQLTPSIRGLVPSMHLADVPISKPEKMFKVGQKITARVLSVDVERRRMKLTLKRTLVKSKLPIISSYEQLQPDMIVHTYVLSVKPQGVVVGLYNDIAGYVPAEELHLSKEHKSLKEIIKLGQVQKARVLSVDPDRKQCRMSFWTKATEAETARSSAIASYSVGQIVSGRVSSVDQLGLTVRLSKHLDAFLYFSHLTDFPENVEAFKKRFSVAKMSLPELLIYEIQPTEKRVYVTMKRSILAAYRTGELPSMTTLKEGVVLQGWVKSIGSFGMLVSFGNSVVGFASKSSVYDEHDHGKRAPFERGQSVRAYVMSVKPDEKKINVSLKPSLTISKDSLYLESYFQEQALLSETHWGAEFAVGSVVSAQVLALESFGVLASVKTSNGSTTVNALAIPAQYQLKPKIGEAVQAVVLDADPIKKILDISLLPSKLKSAKDRVKSEAGMAKRSGSKSMEAVIELVKDKYAMVSLLPYPGVIGCVPMAEWNTAIADPFLLFTPGQRVHVIATASKPDASTSSRVFLCLEGGLMHPSSTSLASTEDIREGMLVKCRVLSKDQHQMMVALGPHIRGRVYISEVTDEVPDEDKSAPPEHVFAPFNVNDVVEGKVLEVHERVSKTDRAISKSSSSVVRTFDITLRKAHLALPAGKLAPFIRSANDVKTNDIVTGVVIAVAKDGIGVALSSRVRGRMRFTSAHPHYTVGQPIRCRVVRVSKKTQQVELTALLQAPTPVAIGQVVDGRVVRELVGDAGVRVSLAHHQFGRVHLTDISDRYSASISLKKGEAVRCFVLGVDEKQIDLSLRLSRVAPETADPLAPNKEIKSLADLTNNQLVQGYVRVTNEKGCFVALSRNIVGRVLISQLSDGFIRDPKVAFPPGRLVTARVVSVDLAASRVELSLKRSALFKTKHYLFIDVKPGMKINGTVKAVKDFGVFVELDNSTLSGMCHKTEVADEPIAGQLSDLYKVGDYVRCLVLRTRPEKRTISLSIKPSHFKDDKPEEVERSDSELSPAEAQLLKQMLSAEAPLADTPARGARLIKEEIEKQKKLAEVKKEEADDADGEEVVQPEQLDLLFGSDDEEDEDAEELYGATAVPAASKLAASSTASETALPSVGFQWEEGKVEVKSEPGIEPKKKRKADEVESTPKKMAPAAKANTSPTKIEEDEGEDASSSSDDDSDAADEPSDLHSDSKPAGKSRSAKKAARARVESETREAEERLLEDRPPETAVDFDRLLLAAPNSSFLWIKYIAHLLSAGEQAGARAVAERALNTINYREQKERLNVWVALMNLENIYGTQDSLMKVFQRALAVNDPKTIHFHLIEIFERSGNTSMVESTFKAMIRKFKESQKMWTRYITFQFKQKKPQEASAILHRSLQSLPKRKHISITSKFAQLEFTMGAPERGRTVFEQLLADNPKRVDLWNVYLDMEISKAGTADTIRHLFDRVCSLNLSTKKMKFFFKRYLNWEKEHGNESTQQRVKDMARQYLETKLSAC